jgi:hypothetical protein
MVASPPQVISKGLVRFIIAEAARSAVELSQPFEMLSPSTYEAWKDVEINFDPRTRRRNLSLRRRATRIMLRV